MKAALVLAAPMLAVAVLASADVTITSSMTGRAGNAPGGPAGRASSTDVSGTQVSFYKGAKLRTDSTMRGTTRTTIVDLGAKTIFVIDHAAKSAIRHAITQSTGDAKATMTDVTLTPTGKTRILLGQSSDEYAWSITFVDFPASNGAARKTRWTVSGTAWLVSGGPLNADYTSFHATAADLGLPVNAPAPPVARNLAAATAAVQVALAARGVAYALDSAVAFEDITTSDTLLDRQPVPPGAPRTQAGNGGTSSMVVTKVSADPIPDSTFEVPAGYSVKSASVR
ncbi:MAG: hypothetical protein JNM38_17795 [Acidobacteria bacterium]|nr:hypothetical protein [Acidobacteriota bacterium]